MIIISKLKNNRTLMPVHILAIFALWTIGFFVNHKIVEPDTTYFPDTQFKFYIGLGAILVNYVSYFYFRPAYKYLLFLSLVLGLFGALNFSKLDLAWTFNAGSLEFKATAVIAVFTSIPFLLILSPKADNAIQPIVVPVDEIRVNEDKEKFLKLYEDKTTEELRTIVEDKRFTKGAIEAAVELLKEKQLN